jgi:hypothetical protein
MLNTTEKAVFMAKMSGKWIELGNLADADRNAALQEMIELGIVKEVKTTMVDDDGSEEEYIYYRANVNFAFVTENDNGNIFETELEDGQEFKLVDDSHLVVDKIYKVRMHRAINTGV